MCVYGDLPHPPAARAEEGLLSGEPCPVAQAGVAPGIPAPHFCAHHRTSFFHFPCFLHNHLTGGVLISEVTPLIMTASFGPSDFHGTRLSTEIKTEWPYSLQEEAEVACTVNSSGPAGRRPGRTGTPTHGKVTPLTQG